MNAATTPRALAALGVATLAVAVAGGTTLSNPLLAVAACASALVVAATVRWLSTTNLLEFSVFWVVVLHGMSVARDSHFPILDFTREARVPLTMLVLVFLVAGRPIGLLSNPGWAAVAAPLAFSMWALLGGLFASDPGSSVFYATWLALNIAIIGLLIAASRDPGEAWRQFVGMDRWVGLGFVVISLLLILGGDPQALGSRWLGNERVPGYVGMFLGPNWFAFVGVMTVALWLARREYDPPAHSPTPVRVVMFLCAIAVLLTTARTGFLGVALGLAFHLRRDFRRLDIGRILRAMPGILALLAVLTILVTQTDPGRAVLGRFVLESDPAEVEESGRIRIWLAFMKMYVANPVFGIGFFTSIPRDEFELVRNLGEAKDPHSTVIALLFTTGIVGTLLFALILAGAARGIRHPGAAPFRRSASAFMITTLPYFLLETVASGPGSPAAWPLWFLLLCARAWNGMPRQAGGAGDWNPLDHAVALPRRLPTFEPMPPRRAARIRADASLYPARGLRDRQPPTPEED